MCCVRTWLLVLQWKCKGACKKKKKSNSGSETKKRHLFSSVVKVQFVKSIYNFLKMKLIENVEKESRAVVYTQVVGQKHAVIGRLIALAPYFFTSTPTRLIYSSPSVKENQSFWYTPNSLPVTYKSMWQHSCRNRKWVAFQPCSTDRHKFSMKAVCK